ncbi:hypothetical protein AB4Z13_03050 [Rhizobium sp. YAF28]|jgi:hypothetical protein|uniref:hypothetical protein n=1 Tax=Rhizobium sp. YAF28 TaxID=3233081 RepID=UPI003F9B724A
MCPFCAANRAEKAPPLFSNNSCYFLETNDPVLQCSGIIGEVAGQTVQHAHLHVIGRFADEPLAGHGIRHHLKQANNRRA